MHVYYVSAIARARAAQLLVHVTVAKATSVGKNRWTYYYKS